MTQFNLTLLTTIGIQDYIFSSNRLQENIGASEIVHRATTMWMFDVLESRDENRIKKFKHNIDRPYSLDWDYNPGFQIEDITDDNAVEVINAAGGSAFLIFRSHEKAVEFTKAITFKVLRDGVGLTLLAKHISFDWKGDILGDAHDANGKTSVGIRRKLIDLMEEHIYSRQVSSPVLGLSVTAICDSTGLTATRIADGTQSLDGREFEILIGDQKKQESEKNRLISRGTAYKIAARDLSRERLIHLVGEKILTKDNIQYGFPSDIDNLGRVYGEESYVAVIHADGNRFGNRFEGLTVDQPNNREFIKSYRKFSKSIETVCKNALRKVVEKMIACIEVDEGNKQRFVGGKIPLVKKNDEWYLPFRPLVFGGDDVTFLCNGQLGVELAVHYLSALENEAQNTELQNIHASAGVAIVKMHYPFARAYKLAEELTASAKTLNRDPQPDCSAIDWHFAQSGLSGSLESIRKREFTVPAGRLNLRPLKLEDWPKLESVIAEFNGPYWGEKHNKVVGLREPLRISPLAVEKYRQDFELKELPKFDGANVQASGWQNNVCYYFDAIELLDHHVSLKNKEAAK